MSEELKCTETLVDPLAATKKISQAELAKQYIYYSCTPLKYKVAEVQTPVASQNDKVDVTETGDKDMAEDAPLDTDELLNICQDKKIKNLTTACTKKKLAEKSKTSRQREKGKVYEFGVIYKKVSGKMGVRKFKVLKGNAPDKFNSAHLYPEMRNKFSKWLVSHKDFSLEAFEKCGGIFNKKFWEVNIAWGEDDSLQGNLTCTDLLLCNKLQQQQ